MRQKLIKRLVEYWISIHVNAEGGTAYFPHSVSQVSSGQRGKRSMRKKLMNGINGTTVVKSDFTIVYNRICIFMPGLKKIFVISDLLDKKNNNFVHQNDLDFQNSTNDSATK